MLKSKKLHITFFDVAVTALVILITIVVAYPLYFCFIASFSDPNEVALGHTFLWIKEFTVESYEYVLKDERVWTGYRNSIIYTVLGTMYNLALTIPAAYVLSKNDLPYRGVLSWYFFITMYIGGGMIPEYLLRRSLGMIGNPIVLIIGSGVSCYNLIVTRQFFSTSIPSELYEAARIDGAGEGRCFARVAMPLAKPILAVMTLYYGVGHWNGYFSALIYLNDEDWQPLQLVLRKILILSEMNFDIENMNVNDLAYMLQRAQMALAMKYSVIIISSLPLIILYPFLQKYFEKGIMIGAVKG